MTGYARDSRYAARGLRRAPLFTLVAVLTLAVGLAVTGAMFAVLQSVVLEPLPYPDSDRLASVRHPVPGINPDLRWNMSAAGFFSVGDSARSIERIGAYVRQDLHVSLPEGGDVARAAMVTATLLPMLAAQAHLGRLIVDDDDRPGGPSVAVLSQRYWERAFAADSSVVGNTILVEGEPMLVVGVVEDVSFPDGPVELWLPLQLDPAAPAQNYHYLSVLAQLRPGVSVDAADAEVREIVRQFPERFPSAYPPPFMEGTQFAGEVALLRDVMIGNAGFTIALLFAGMIVVLLIALGNVLNLVLIRTEEARRNEAVQAALGATRADRLRRQVLQGLFLAIPAGIIALAATRFVLPRVLAAAPREIPRILEVSVSGAAVALIVISSLVAGVVIGVVPYAAVRTEAGTLQSVGLRHTATRRRHTLRIGLVVAQVAFTLVLLTASALALTTYRRLQQVDPGFDPEGALLVELSLPAFEYEDDRAVAAVYRQLTERLEAFDQVVAAGLTTSLPLHDASTCAAIHVEARALDEPPCVRALRVSPGYFEAMGISVQGRALSWWDIDGATGAAVVSRSLASQLWPDEDPMGQGVRANGRGEPFYRVVGVVDDPRSAGLDRTAVPSVYFPIESLPDAQLWYPPRDARLVIRGASDRGPEVLAGLVRSIVTELNRDIAIGSIQPLEDIVKRSYARQTFATLLITIAGTLALGLSVVGIYGVFAYIVRQNTSEIGIRMALGADAGRVVRGVLRYSTLALVTGIAFGALVSVALVRAAESLMFGAGQPQATAIVGASIVLLVLGTVSSFFSARSATRIDPAQALRAE